MNVNSKNITQNRLIHEKSPYLLQHAYNPVDWFPWGEEAFAKAKAEDKPIFLSIGYSTCHWCHVMERESFEDEEVAKVLNRDFVSIKVDREERPDIDHIYMKICQGLTGHGGWPLTIIMTPEQEAFYAATYLPKENRGGMSGLIQVLAQINRLWQEDRQRVLQSGQKITAWLQEDGEAANHGGLSPSVFEQAFKAYNHRFDSQYGGFGEAPKFPSPHNLLFLLRYHFYYEEPSALEIVEKSLDSMYRGGIYDHIGFGFSRYSTDQMWLVPHFEKMLYDNALLAMVYLEAYQFTKKQKYADVARDIFTYVLRDMTSSEGGFYSAEDADSEGEEGKFYVWTMGEVMDLLGEEKGKQFCEIYDISLQGNFEERNIPNLINAASGQDYRNEFSAQREMLFNEREKRIHPFKDDKILTSWNGLMIAALSMGGRVLKEPAYLKAASNAADFIMTHLCRENGRLMARFREGESQYLGYASDYTCMIWGLIELYQSGFQSKYLMEAIRLNNDLIRYFWDEKNGGLFMYGEDGEQLISRPKEMYDGAMPSDNAMGTCNFIRLARLTGDTELEVKAEQQFKAFGAEIKQQPTAYAFWLTAAIYWLHDSREIVVVGNADQDDTTRMLETIQGEYLPDTVTILKDDKLEDMLEYLVDMKKINDQAVAYVCSGHTCQAPVSNIDALKAMISEV